MFLTTSCEFQFLQGRFHLASVLLNMCTGPSSFPSAESCASARSLVSSLHEFTHLQGHLRSEPLAGELKIWDVHVEIAVLS